VKNDHLASLEQELRHALGARVDIKQASKGRGKITIHFNGHEEFERIRNFLSDTHTERRQAS
jgi:ParB family chromosome partitioning protein